MSDALFRRATFEARLAEMHRRAQGTFLWLIVVALILASLVALPKLVPGLDWRPVLYVEAGVVLVVLLVRQNRLHRLARDIGLACPSCAGDLWGRAAKYGPTLEEIVLQQGRCPHCGVQILDPSETRPGVKQTPVSRGRNLAGVLILVGLMAGSLYYGSRTMRRSQGYRCAERYAQARTAADTLRVDATGSALWRCRQFRRGVR